MADNQNPIFQSASEGQQKFDYFITGLTGALFAYLAQAFEPEKFGWNAATLESLALILLVISFFIGLKRLESVVILLRLNHEFLSASKKAGQITQNIANGLGSGFNPETGEIVSAAELPAKRDYYMAESRSAKKQYEHVARRNERYYRLRNLFLIVGFIAILAGKLIEPYLGPPIKAQQQCEVGDLLPAACYQSD